MYGDLFTSFSCEELFTGGSREHFQNYHNRKEKQKAFKICIFSYMVNLEIFYVGTLLHYSFHLISNVPMLHNGCESHNPG